MGNSQGGGAKDTEDAPSREVKRMVREAGGAERLEDVSHCSLAVDVALLVDGRSHV